jgi:predicted acylesterase/phospholipase RssA
MAHTTELRRRRIGLALAGGGLSGAARRKVVKV